MKLRMGSKNYSMNKFKVFGLVLIGAAVLFGAVALADTVYQPSALFDTQLNVAMDNVSTSTMTLQLGVDKSGNALNAFMCFTIDGGLSNVEYVCGSASGTVVSNLVRGIDFTDGVTTSTSRYQKHRIGADVKQTDYPYLSQIARLLGGTGTFPAILNYASNINSGSFTSPTQIITKSYADSLSFAGAPNGNSSTKGIYQEATRAQTAAGIATGTTGADLIVPNLYFNATSTSTTTVPVTNASGTLDPNFIRQDASTSYNFIGTTTLSSPVFSNATSGLLFANASGSPSTIAKGASTGSVLAFNNGAWGAGTVSSFFASSSLNTVATTSNQLLMTMPLPVSNSSTSVYETTFTEAGQATGSNIATSTITITAGGVSSTICTFNQQFLNPNNISLWARIMNTGATTSQLVISLAGGATGGSGSICNSTILFSALNLNMASSPSIQWFFKETNANVNALAVTSTAYVIQ